MTETNSSEAAANTSTREARTEPSNSKQVESAVGEVHQWRAKRTEKLAAERQLRRRVDRLEKAARYISKVLYPMREELHRLENSRLALERLIFEAEGKVKKCPSAGVAHKRTKSAKSKKVAAVSLLAKLDKSELERLLAQALAREQGAQLPNREDTSHE